LIAQADPTGRDAPHVLVCENRPADAPENVILVMGNAALPVFVTVTGSVALAVLAGTLPNASGAGDIVKGTVPVPLTTAVCVTPDPLTFSVAQTYPDEIGLNNTLMVQVDPTGMDAAQVLVCENRLADAPENVMPVMGNAALPLFVTVTGCAPLAVLVCTVPNATDVGDTA
jgi:hypothetical protein